MQREHLLRAAADMQRRRNVILDRPVGACYRERKMRHISTLFTDKMRVYVMKKKERESIKSPP